MGKRYGAVKTCAACGSEFKGFEPSQRFCSFACGRTAVRGVRSAGNTYVMGTGYRTVYLGQGKWRLEHRLVMEKALGRPLARREEVHHINGDKLDNALSNLRLLSPVEHAAAHADHVQYRRSRVELICQQCGTAYEREAGRAAESKYCSGTCRSRAVSLARWKKAKS